MTANRENPEYPSRRPIAERVTRQLANRATRAIRPEKNQAQRALELAKIIRQRRSSRKIP